VGAVAASGAGRWCLPLGPGGAVVNHAEIQAAYLACVIADDPIAVDDPRTPDVRALLERHLQFARAQTPPEHSFALDLDGLLDPAITMFSFRAHGSLLAIGAIKRLGPHHAEIKSMHTAEAARGRGIGRAMLAHLLGAARARGFRQVSLETGTTAAFAPARALYHSAGFVPCGPFADYQPSKDNLFMTLGLGAVQSTGR
jgi:putative acetyltransferase